MICVYVSFTPYSFCYDYARQISKVYDAQLCGSHRDFIWRIPLYFVLRGGSEVHKRNTITVIYLKKIMNIFCKLFNHLNPYDLSYKTKCQMSSGPHGPDFIESKA